MRIHKKLLSLLGLLITLCISAQAVPLSEERIKELAIKFAPEIRFHKSENYFPCDMSLYISQCALQSRDPHSGKISLEKFPITVNDISKDKYCPKDYAELINKQPPTNASPETKAEFDQDLFEAFDKISEYFISPLHLYKDADPKFKDPNSERIKKVHAGGPLQSVPCYFHAKERPNNSGIVIQYIFMYAHQGPMLPENWITDLLPKIMDIGVHEGDVEHLDVYLDNNDQLQWVYYSAHGSKPFGEMLSASEVPLKEGTHPIAYAAKYGHALHSKDIGFDSPINIKSPLKSLMNLIKKKPDVGYTFDTTSKDGPIWSCWKSSLVNLGDREKPTIGQEWIRFNGRLGSTFDNVNGSPVKHIKNFDFTFNNSPASPAIDNWWWRTNVQKFLLTTLTGVHDGDVFDLSNEIPTRMRKLEWKIISDNQADVFQFFIKGLDPAIAQNIITKNRSITTAKKVFSNKQAVKLFNFKTYNLKSVEGPFTIEIWGLEE